MARTLSSRQRTLTLTGSITDGVYSYFDPSPPSVNYKSGANIGFLGLFCSFNAYPYNLINSIPQFSFNIDVVVGVGTAGTSSASTTYNYVGGGAAPWIASVSFSGSFTITADVEEYFDDSLSADTDTDVLSPTYQYPYYPFTATNVNIDPTTGLKLTYGQRLKVGGDLSITVTCGPATITHSIVIAAATPVIYPCESNILADCTSVSNFKVFDISPIWDGIPLSAPYDKIDANARINALSGSNVTFFGSSTTASINTQLSAKRTLDIAGVVMCATDKNPGVVGLFAQVKSTEVRRLIDTNSEGVFSLSGTQEQYVASGYIGGSFKGEIRLSEYSPVKVWIRNDWAVARQEDTSDWRVQIHGRKWDSLTVTKAAIQSVDGCSSLTAWAAGANTTLSLFGGFIRALVVGGKGSFVKTFPNDTVSFIGKSMKGYRYLTLQLFADANATVTVVIGNKEWDVKVTTGGSVQVDLTQPFRYTSGTLPKTDATETWLPVDASIEGAYWGVNHALTLTIKNIPDGRDVRLQGITLGYTQQNNLWVTPAFKDFELLYAPSTVGMVTTETFARRLMIGETDWRTSFEYWDFIKVHTFSDVIDTTTYSWYSISQMNAGINTVNYPADGWSSVEAGSFPDTYHTNARAAAWIYGGGLFYDGSTWSGKPATGLVIALPAQALLDEVEVYAGAGDWAQLNGGGYGVSIPIRAGKQLRAAFFGEVGDGVGEITASVDVVATDANDHQDYGAGITDSIGGYKTELKYARGSKSAKVEAKKGKQPYPQITGNVFARKRHRRCFAIQNPKELLAKGLSYHHSREGNKHAIAFTADTLDKDGKTIQVARVGIAKDLEGNDFEQVSEDIAEAVRVNIAWQRHSTSPVLFLITETKTGEVKLWQSANDGRDFTVAKDISTNAEFGCMVISRQGHHFFWIDRTSKKIKSLILTTLGDEVKAAFDVTETEVDEDQIDAWYYEFGNGTWKIKLMYRESGTIKMVNSFNGIDFS